MRFNRSLGSLLYHPNRTSKPRVYRWYMTHFKATFFREEPDKEYFVPPPIWYRAAHARLIKLSYILQNVAQLDGRLINTTDSTIITDAEVISPMQSFKSIAKYFIPSLQIPCLSKPNELKSVKVNSLTKIADLLKITAQQRKLVRTTILPQVTRHHIWREALLEVLKNVKLDIDSLKCQSSSSSMAEQIVVTCINFLTGTTDIPSLGSPSWMKLAPVKKVVKKEANHKWEEVVEMYEDLIECLTQEKAMSYNLTKLQAMREGLYEIRDIVIERDVNYKEARQKDCLIQKILAKKLGHSSKCLFTLLLYHLYGDVRDVEVEVCGGLHRNGKKLRLCVGKVLTSGDKEMVLYGVRELSRALGVFKFVWETAGGTNGDELELHGHLCCVGAEEEVIKYRGYDIFLHTIDA